MIRLPGYFVDRLIYESAHSRIYRGNRLLDDLPVIFKILNGDSSSPERRARFGQEYELTRKLQSSSILAAHGLESYQGMPVMILEDFGGTSLNNLHLAGTLLLKEWLQLAMRIAACLGQLHQRHVMHKDINPSNIVWNRQTDQVKLIDLGIATELSREAPEIRNPDRLEGTLAYISPEQTGRMNRAMDYRTDFYSLGITFYELLTGSLPFSSGDALEMVHAHIARLPALADQVKPGVPPMISAIINKLMGKTAEERYQSAAGLHFDLLTCLQTLDASQQILHFTLEQKDFSGRLQLSQKLYGRENQIATLLEVYQRASQGPAELLLVSGYSGVGKSALVHEIHQPVTQNRGYFIEGKFDQFKRDIPYASLSQAFREMIQQILTKGDTVVAGWREKLLLALGNNAQVIIDVIPSLEMIVGAQPPAPDLPAAQKKNRFNLAFRNFVGVFAAADHPLVIFLDDLQWADSPTLELISLLLRHPAKPHLLVIGAYRDNEITSTHALKLMLDEMKKQGASIHDIALPPLHLGDVSSLLQDSLQGTANKVATLAQLCLSKTQGNPFFLNQFLKHLVDRDMLFRDAVDGCWNWDTTAIANADITDNIVDLLVGKLQTLAPATQRVLQGAACLGNVFDLKTLAITCDMAAEDVGQLLWPALRDELIVPLDDRFKFGAQPVDIMLDQATDAPPDAHYRFQHDRVQQAANLLSNDSERAAMHLTIGRLWCRSLSPSELQVRLLDVVNHLNLGSGGITDQAERRQLAQFNVDAARRAKASAAYKPGLGYATAALELAGGDDWQTDYDFQLGLHLDAAELAYLCAEVSAMDRYIEAVLTHARNRLDQTKATEIRIQSHITSDRFKEAVTTGLEALELLDIPITKRLSRRSVQIETLKLNWAMRGKNVEELAQLPMMTDPRILAAMRILNKLLPATYYGVPKYTPFFVLQSTSLTVKYGRAPWSTYCFANYGLMLSGMQDNIEKGTQFGKLASALLATSGSESDRGRVLVVIHGIIEPWYTPLHDTLSGMMHAHLTSLRSGDFEFTANAAAMYCRHLFHCGRDLIDAEKQAAAFSNVIEQFQRPTLLHTHKLSWQCMQNLLGRAPDPTVLIGAVCDAPFMEEVKRNVNAEVVMFVLSLNQLYLLYLFGKFEEAHDNAVRRGAQSNTTAALSLKSLFHFYDSLTNLELLDAASDVKRKALYRTVAINQKKLQGWAKHCPENFLSKWHLVEARLAQSHGKIQHAIQHFEQAIKLAKENGYLQEEALAKELTGRFYLSQGQESLAQFYLEKAQQTYGRWGAVAKVRAMAEQYPQWLRDNELSENSNMIAHGYAGNSSRSVSSSGSSGMLDMVTVMKASQALSQEIVLAHLLKRLMAVVIESAAAQRGVLLLKKEKDWYLEAEKSAGQAEATVLQSALLDEMNPDVWPMPTSLLHYVARTRESIVIHEAKNEKLVAGDPYVMTHHPRSLLVVPILRHGELTGMLYLENNSASGAFTEKRLEMLHLLASQAAISIENARLYADMEALAHANEMQAEHQSELTRFLAVASHDLRQPMHALNLYLGALSNFDLPDSARPVLDNVQQCAQIMDGMFLALLDMSRLDAQLVEPLRQPFPVAMVMSHLSVEFAPRAEAKGIRFHIDCTADWVESDMTLVEQVLRNLVANAVRYTESGEITISCMPHQDSLRVSVRDTGIGISPLQQKTVFEDFCQVSVAGRDRTEGLGLGLAIVRRLGHLLDMPVTLVSGLGLGSTFSIDLPRVAGRVVPFVPAVGQGHGSGMLAGKLVVVVDDEQTILDAMRVLLEQWGCNVVTAVSGSDALVKLADAERVPDVLICDYRLNFNETGLAVIELLWGEFNTEISALLITGDAAPDRIQEILSSGLPVLHKPVQAATLLEALIELVAVQPNF